MADTTRAKNHLQNTLSSLENTTIWWVRKIEELVSHTALQLSMSLSDDNFFVDQDSINTLKKIHDYMKEDTEPTGLHPKLDKESSGLPTWIPKQIEHAYTSLHGWAWKTNIDNRIKECKAILDCASNIVLDTTLNDVSDVIWRTTWGPVVLDLSWMTTWTGPNEYKLCDESGRELRYITAWGYYLINVWWKIVKMYWVTVDKINHRVDFQNVKFDPTNVDISTPFKLSVNAIYGPIGSAWNIKVVSNKTFSLKLNDSVAVVEAWRQNVIQDYEDLSSPIAARGVIKTHLNNVFNWQKDKLLKDAIERLLTRSWSTTYWTLTQEQKDEYLSRMLDSKKTTIPWVSATWLMTDLKSFNDFTMFKEWFANDNRARNKDSKNTKSVSIYKQYLHDHFRWESINYFGYKLDELLQADPNTDTFLKAQLSNYLIELESNKREDPALRTKVENILKSDDVKMKKDKGIWQWWKVLKFEPIRKKDNNYMRFFSWSSKEITNQTVDLESGQLKYDMKIDVSKGNKIWVEIKIDGQEPITLQSWDYDPTTLARRILREPSISSTKARIHMVYSLYKGLLQICKDKDIKLEYFDNKSPWAMHEITLASNWDIVLNTVKYGTTPPYKIDKEILFDEKLFHNLNQFKSSKRHNSLQEWIQQIALHFSHAMNHIHDNYRKSIKRGISRWLQRWGKTNLPVSFWSSPIRKLVNKCTKNATNFEFTTSVGTTQIDFKDNKFTVTTPDSPKPIVSKSLWKILNTRVHKRRIFDWVERDIVEAVYSNLIKKMRENTKVARTHFWVVDDLTGHVYVIDPSWHFGRINRDAINWKNLFNFNGRGEDNWVISEKLLRWDGINPWYTYHRLTASEEKELLKNPLLMQWFIKAMNRRMWIMESIRAWVDRNRN